MDILKVNPRLYSLRVVYSCAYLFLDKAYISLDGDPQKGILVKIEAKDGKSSRKIAQEFMNELLSASLRYQISRENRKIRECIVGSALLSVSEERAPRSCGCADETDKNKHAAMNWGHVKNSRNYGGPAKKSAAIADPLGIGIPWEEKYGKDGKNKL